MNQLDLEQVELAERMVMVYLAEELIALSRCHRNVYDSLLAGSRLEQVAFLPRYIITVPPQSSS